MQEVKPNRSIDVVLLELERVLRDERTALVALDAAAIGAISRNKAELESELATFVHQKVVTQSGRLINVKRQLQENLVLLVQARDFIQHRLGIEPRPAVSNRASTPAVSGSRLNLRG